MKVSRENILIDGHLLNCTVINPSESTKTRAVCLFTHGQGDYSARYTDVLHPFTQQGIRCIAFDLPGHGMSPGRRGHVGDISMIDSIIKKSLNMAENLPYGIAGHSMGGLLTLRHLTLALLGELPMPKFCWINSALLSPTQNKPDWFVTFASFLAKIHPECSVKTGATPELCQTNVDKKFRSDKKQLGHQYISIGWGLELINSAAWLHKILPTLRSEIPFLYTQGGNDLICPDNIAESFFERLKLSQKRYILYPHMRHETFAEPGCEQLFNDLETWLDENADIIYPLPSSKE